MLWKLINKEPKNILDEKVHAICKILQPRLSIKEEKNMLLSLLLYYYSFETSTTKLLNNLCKTSLDVIKVINCHTFYKSYVLIKSDKIQILVFFYFLKVI